MYECTKLWKGFSINSRCVCKQKTRHKNTVGKQWQGRPTEVWPLRRGCRRSQVGFCPRRSFSQLAPGISQARGPSESWMKTWTNDMWKQFQDCFYKLSLSHSSKSEVKSELFICSIQRCSLELCAPTCTWPSSCGLQRRSCPGTPFYMDVMNILVVFSCPRDRGWWQDESDVDDNERGTGSSLSFAQPLN